MSSRAPLLGAVALVLLALLFAFWSTGEESSPAHPRTLAERADAKGELSNRIALLKDRPLPGAPGGDQPPPPEDPSKAGEESSANGSETPGVTHGEARATRRALRRQARLDAEARRTAIAGGQAPASEQDVEVYDEEVAGGGVPQQPVPTFEPESLYDGLSQDDLVELMVALRRLRDAGVFHTLTPEQYYLVQQLMPDRQGIRDADRITQEILGMSVGEWLAHERGPRGRFVLQ